MKASGSEKPLFTLDRWMGAGGVLNEADYVARAAAKEACHGRRGAIGMYDEVAGSIVVYSGIEEMMVALRPRMEKFTAISEDVAIRILQKDGASEYVRRIRIDEHHSWRSVSAMCWHQYGREPGFWPQDIPKTFQLVGMALCDKVAAESGEHYMEAPWN